MENQLIYYAGTNKIKEENNFKNGIKDGVSLNIMKINNLKLYTILIWALYIKKKK